MTPILKELQISQEALDLLKHLKKDPNQGDSQGEMDERIEEMEARESKKFQAEMAARDKAEQEAKKE